MKEKTKERPQAAPVFNNTTKVANQTENAKNFAEFNAHTDNVFQSGEVGNNSDLPIIGEIEAERIKAIKFAGIANAITSDAREQAKEEELPFIDIWADDEDEDIPFLFSRGGKGVASRGNIMTVKGRTGARKSALAIDFILAAFGKSTIFATELKDLKVLWADTEQPKKTIKVRARTAFKGRGLAPGIKLHTLYLKEIDEHSKRQEIFFRALDAVMPDLAIIDVITDLAEPEDDASNANAKLFVERFTKGAAEYNCNIVCIIHLNKSENDTNAAGHIGTVVEQKSEIVFLLEKGKTEISNSKYRYDAELLPINFTHKEDGTLTAIASEVEDARLKQLRDLAEHCFAYGEEYRGEESYRRIQRFTGGKDRTAKSKLAEMVTAGILTKRKPKGNEAYYALTNLHTLQTESML